jgi:hypothetical protein
MPKFHHKDIVTRKKIIILDNAFWFDSNALFKASSYTISIKTHTKQKQTTPVCGSQVLHCDAEQMMKMQQHW